MDLAVLRPHGQSRHEARQSYSLELPSLEVICPRWRRRHPTGGAYPAQSQGQNEVPNTDGGRGGQVMVNAMFFKPPNIPLPVAPISGPRHPVKTWRLLGQGIQSRPGG